MSPNPHRQSHRRNLVQAVNHRQQGIGRERQHHEQGGFPEWPTFHPRQATQQQAHRPKHHRLTQRQHPGEMPAHLELAQVTSGLCVVQVMQDAHLDQSRGQAEPESDQHDPQRQAVPRRLRRLFDRVEGRSKQHQAFRNPRRRPAFRLDQHRHPFRKLCFRIPLRPSPRRSTKGPGLFSDNPPLPARKSGITFKIGRIGRIRQKTWRKKSRSRRWTEFSVGQALACLFRITRWQAPDCVKMIGQEYDSDDREGSFRSLDAQAEPE